MKSRPFAAVLLLMIMVCSACGGGSATNAPPAATAVPLATQPAQTVVPPQPAAASAHVAYVSAGDLWLRAVPDGTPRRVTTDQGAHAPRWSPSGMWLAFCDHDQLFVVARDAGAAESLGPCSGQWLPTRDAVAFASEESTTIVDVASKRRRALAAPATAWKADETVFAQVAITQTDPNDPASRAGALRLVAADGSRAADVTPPDQPAGIMVARWIGDHLLFWTDPMFSASILADGVPLYAVAEAGGAATKLVPRMLAAPDFIAAAPDGSRVAVTEGDDRRTWTNKQIVLLNLATAERTPLTDSATTAFSPAWSPDGQQISYVAAPDIGPSDEITGGEMGMQQRHIWLMEPSGARKRQLTNDPAFRDERPRWTNDGSHMVFVRMNSGGQASLWMMAADGGGAVRLGDTLGQSQRDQTDGAGFYGYHDWDDWFDVR